MPTGDETLDFSGASMELFFSEVSTRHATTFGHLRDQAADLCRFDTESNAPFSYHEYYAGGEGINIRRSLLVCLRDSPIGLVYWIIVNDESPEAVSDGRKLGIAEYVVAEDFNALTVAESEVKVNSCSDNWETNELTGPILYKTERGASKTSVPELRVWKGKDYRTLLPEANTGYEKILAVFDLQQRQTKIAEDLAGLLGSNSLGSVWHVPVVMSNRSKV